MTGAATSDTVGDRAVLTVAPSGCSSAARNPSPTNVAATVTGPGAVRISYAVPTCSVGVVVGPRGVYGGTVSTLRGVTDISRLAPGTYSFSVTANYVTGSSRPVTVSVTVTS